MFESNTIIPPACAVTNCIIPKAVNTTAGAKLKVNKASAAKKSRAVFAVPAAKLEYKKDLRCLTNIFLRIIISAKFPAQIKGSISITWCVSPPNKNPAEKAAMLGTIESKKAFFDLKSTAALISNAFTIVPTISWFEEIKGVKKSTSPKSNPYFNSVLLEYTNAA